MKPQESTELAEPSLMVSAEFDVDNLVVLTDIEVPLSGLPEDLSELSISQLTALCDQVFSEMDQEFPGFGAQEDYQLLVEELLSRGEKAPAEGTPELSVEGAECDEQAS